MRQGPNNKRGRGRGNFGGNGSGGNNRPRSGGGGNGMPNRNQTFDSNGPDVRIRGNAFQVHEKYVMLAHDATAAGDRIMAESYFQYAEHYYRIINAAEYGPDGQRRPRQDDRQNGQYENQNGPYDNNNGQYNNGPYEGQQGFQPSFSGAEPQPDIRRGGNQPPQQGEDNQAAVPEAIVEHRQPPASQEPPAYHDAPEEPLHGEPMHSDEGR